MGTRMISFAVLLGSKPCVSLVLSAENLLQVFVLIGASWENQCCV
jgi:hypothetical protein